MDSSLYPLILAGGSGTRLWPLSRQDFPKQFLKIGSPDSLVRETVLRLFPLISWESVRIICGKNHEKMMRHEFPEFHRNQFLLEPVGRNTAAAIALAAYLLLKKDPQAILWIFPADQKILEKDHPVFRETLEAGTHLVRERGGFLTLGVQPTFPATGFGYLHQGEKIQEGSHPVYRLKEFREKPDFETAERYLQSGEYFWNSGMFLWKASDFWKAYETYLPEDARLMQQLPDSPDASDWEEKIHLIYPRLTSISVDYAILEKSPEVYMIPARFAWDDVGSLKSIFRYFPQEGDQNAVEGNAVTLDAHHNLILSDEGVVACLGVENLVIIRNKDAVLILPQDRSEEVKRLLEEMKNQGLNKVL